MITRFILAFTLAWSFVVHAQKPNIVMIISDDQAWTDYGFMGHPHIATPNLDKLSKEGLTFTRGYVPSSLCCPSLATMITGLYPHQSKITSNDPPKPAGMKPREFQTSAAFKDGRERTNQHLDAVPTLPKLLVKNGYMALQTGKWWQGTYQRGGFTHGMTQGGRHGDAGLDIGRKTLQPIYDFIGEAKQAQKPFFVWYAPMMPHDPHTPPQALRDKYLEVQPNQHIAKYWAMVEWFDETCGTLLKHLDDHGLRENTIVVYVSDNGWITNPKTGRYADKSKQSQYDGGLRSPIMLRWPAKVQPKMSDALASSLDFAPTILKAAGLQPTPDMPGIDLLDDSAVAARKTLYGECFTHNFVDLNVPASSLRWRWIIDGHSKLIVPHKANQPDDIPELYDLAADPTEEKNLATDQPAKVTELTAKLDAWWKP
jgi:uncharacterized sulfatase